MVKKTSERDQYDSYEAKHNVDVTSFKVRMLTALTCLIIGFIVLSVHLYILQVVNHEVSLEKARRLYTKNKKQKGQRGQILDYTNNLLATNIVCNDIYADPKAFKTDYNEILDNICPHLIDSRAKIERRVKAALKSKKKYTRIVLSKGVKMEQAEIIKGFQYKGISFEENTQRSYPQESYLSHTVGTTNSKSLGISGIEQFAESMLKPLEEEIIFEKDTKGNPLSDKDLEKQKKLLNGDDVHLTIQIPIQALVEEELSKMVEKFTPKNAYIIMADPKTGNILALAQYPSFDPNDPAQRTSENIQNRMALLGFEPGSIMKPLSISGAIDFGLVSLYDKFYCEKGYWHYAGKGLRDSGHSYEWLTVEEIIQKSSNIGTAKIAIEMGERRLMQTLQNYGFGKKTKVELTQEASGILKPLKKWDSLSITRFPMGQGILVTPLQIIQAYCALANDGTMMQLHMIDRIESPRPYSSYNIQPKFLRRVIRPSTAQAIKQAMIKVTQEGGTAKRAAIEGYDVAGKTGTAQKYGKIEQADGTFRYGYSHKHYVSSFVGFAPAKDPAFVMLVAADEPQKKHYGGTVCAPYFKTIAEKTLQYLQIPPTKPIPEDE